MNKSFYPYQGAELARSKPKPPCCEHELHMPHMDPRSMKLARAYVVSQPYTGLFSLDVALKTGTVFPNLFEAFPEIR